MNFSLHQTQRLIQLMKCPVHSKSVTVVESQSENGSSLKVSEICCEQFGGTIGAIVKTNLQQEIITQEKNKMNDLFTDIFKG